MEFLQPRSLADALAAKAEVPGAVPIAGGTDVMVEINFDARRPEALLDLNRVPELTAWQRSDGLVRLGAGVTYARLIAELGGLLPGLAMAARTVGSPQIRNRGTVGGNLGAASPAGDCHPVLLAAGAAVEAASLRGSRTIPVAEFFTAPKRSTLAADELITSVLIPVAAGPQQFAKIGTRNAMVIAVCAFALELRPPATTDPDSSVPDNPGSAVSAPASGRPARRRCAPRPPRSSWPARWPRRGCGSRRTACPEPVARRFGELVAAAARPIDDVRGTAAYRRHALSVLARRTLAWAWAVRHTGAGEGRRPRCG